MDHEVETSAQRARNHFRRPLAGSRDLLTKTARNTVTEIVPPDLVLVGRRSWARYVGVGAPGHELVDQR
jgi:hypothetical protein